MDSNQVIGNNLKRLRGERNMSLGQLSAQCGVSKVLLSQIERGEANPTINTIWKIATGLRVYYTELLERPAEASLLVKKEAALVQSDQGGDYLSYSYFTASQDRKLDLFVVELAPGTSHLSVGHLAGSREYVVVNRGRLNLLVGGDTFCLEEGDSLCFEGEKEHTYINTGTEQTCCTTLISYR